MSNRGKVEVLQGTLEIMVLETLAALGLSHGYAVAGRIEQVLGGEKQLATEKRHLNRMVAIMQAMLAEPV